MSCGESFCVADRVGLFVDFASKTRELVNALHSAGATIEDTLTILLREGDNTYYWAAKYLRYKRKFKRHADNTD